MTERQPTVASFARVTKHSFPLEVCRVYIKQVLNESGSLKIAGHALQAATITNKLPRRFKQDCDKKRLVLPNICMFSSSCHRWRIARQDAQKLDRAPRLEW